MLLGDCLRGPNISGQRPCTNQLIITKISFYYSSLVDREIFGGWRPLRMAATYFRNACSR